MTREDLIAALAANQDLAPEWIGDGILMGHTPSLGSLAYLHRLHPRLKAEEISTVEASLGATLPASFAEFLLEIGNGAEVFNISLYGFVEQLHRDPEDRLGQPISLDYGNIFERPAGLEDNVLSIGAMVGWSSRGSLMMSPSGEILLVHPENGRDVAARWKSLNAMLIEEIARQSPLHDRSGHRQASFTETMHPGGRRWETKAEPRSH